jgi:hypothetical protein
LDRAVAVFGNVSSDDAGLADLMLLGIRFAGIYIGNANRGVCVALPLRSSPITNANTTRVLYRLAGFNEMSILDAAIFADFF